MSDSEVATTPAVVEMMSTDDYADDNVDVTLDAESEYNVHEGDVHEGDVDDDLEKGHVYEDDTAKEVEVVIGTEEGLSLEQQAVKLKPLVLGLLIAGGVFAALGGAGTLFMVLLGGPIFFWALVCCMCPCMEWIAVFPLTFWIVYEAIHFGWMWVPVVLLWLIAAGLLTFGGLKAKTFAAIKREIAANDEEVMQTGGLDGGDFDITGASGYDDHHDDNFHGDAMEEVEVAVHDHEEAHVVVEEPDTSQNVVEFHAGDEQEVEHINDQVNPDDIDLAVQ